MMRIIGVDLGTARTGVAIASAGIAQPLTVIAERDDERIVERLAELARDEAATEIVFGIPISLDATEGPSAARARTIARQLEERSGLPVHLWDERLTTAQAERTLVGAGMRRKRRRGVVDKVAATMLLQSYLDAQHSKERS